MSNRCGECGQMMSKDREYLCERCAELQNLRQQVDELEGQLEESVPVEAVHADLRALRPKAEIYDKLLALISLSLSPAQAVDVAFVEFGGYSEQNWSERRGKTVAAVYNNIADAKPKYQEQTQLGEHGSEQTPEEVER